MQVLNASIKNLSLILHYRYFDMFKLLGVIVNYLINHKSYYFQELLM